MMFPSDLKLAKLLADDNIIAPTSIRHNPHFKSRKALRTLLFLVLFLSLAIFTLILSVAQLIARPQLLGNSVFLSHQPLARLLIKNDLLVTTLSNSYRGVPASFKMTPTGLRYAEKLNSDRVPTGPSILFKRPSKTGVLYAVTSGPDEVDNRAVIRETWATQIGRNSRLRFFVGQTQNDTQAQHVLHEMALHGDLVVFEDVVDTYNNLTLKTLALFEWAKYNLLETYIMKVDTDVYVKPRNLRKRLARVPREGLYLGSLVRYGTSNAPYRTTGADKWRISVDDYKDKYYPPHCMGFAYVVSRDLVEPISRCLPRNFQCTAANHPRNTSVIDVTHTSNRGGSYTTCDIDPMCTFQPIRFEDVSVGGILFNHMTRHTLSTNCPPVPEGTSCRESVNQAYGLHTKYTHSAVFVNVPWAKKTYGEGMRCDDDFIALHRVTANIAKEYFLGGEGENVKMCSFAP